MFLITRKKRNEKKKSAEDVIVRVRVLRDEFRRPYYITIFHPDFTLAYNRYADGRVGLIRRTSRSGRPVTNADIPKKLMKEFVALAEKYLVTLATQ